MACAIEQRQQHTRTCLQHYRKTPYSKRDNMGKELQLHVLEKEINYHQQLSSHNRTN